MLSIKRAFFKENNGINLLAEVEYSIAISDQNYKEAFAYTESDGYKELVKERYEKRGNSKKEK